MWVLCVPTSSIRRHLELRPVGFTLLEVVLALALFVRFAGNLVSTYMERQPAQRYKVSWSPRRLLRCQTLIAEIQAGSVPLQNTSKTAFADDDARWQYSLQISDTSLPDLLSVEATVSYAPAQGTLGNVSFTPTNLDARPCHFRDKYKHCPNSSQPNLHADLLARQ
ncbi:MAG: hypothetical protein KatS3mg113_0077 [Planctomycetaceae bacterium]|nr:MAG: hypothetical protein KatS3mg113_0077 [Planctomycetaceae bacterium]